MFTAFYASSSSKYLDSMVKSYYIVLPIYEEGNHNVTAGIIGGLDAEILDNNRHPEFWRKDIWTKNSGQ
jgi:hypothetical protein